MATDDKTKEITVQKVRGISKTKETKNFISDLKEKISLDTQRRKIMNAYIKENLKDGVDFVQIHVSKSCPDKYSCKNQYHFSKPSLSKAGGEKVMSLLHVRAELKKDTETWEMAGSTPGLICYICHLFDERGNIIGEGRGSCDRGEKSRMNDVIKIAEKRARVDAVLGTFGLSEQFTQDVEDLPQYAEVSPAKITPKPVAPKPTKPAAPAPIPVKMMSPDQKQMIKDHLKKAGKTTEDLIEYTKRAFNKEDPRKLTAAEAETVITKLAKLPAITVDESLDPVIKLRQEIAKGIEEEKKKNDSNT